MKNLYPYRHPILAACAASIAIASVLGQDAGPPGGVTRFCRFEVEGRISYGIVEGNRVRAITAPPFASWKKTDQTHPLGGVKLLVPTEPSQVLALAGNYKSHLPDTEVPPKFRIPQPFFKSPSSLVPHGAQIVLPKDAGPTHYEAELVIVIGKTAKRVPKDKALDHVLGVTCGNDVSERYWQNDEENKDVQWWRAKGTDTFGPCGPVIVSGLNYDKLKLTLRLNGRVRQEENTRYMIHDVASTVSFISQYITLHPGDLIFTGTPGKTDEIKPGDAVEVELEGVGVLRNEVTRER